MTNFLLSICKPSIAFFIAMLLIFGNASGQQQNIDQFELNDDNTYDQIPLWLLEQQQDLIKAPSVVVTIGDYDNFDLGTDLAESHISVNPTDLDEFFCAYNVDETHRTQDGHDWDNATSVAWGTTIRGDVLTAYDALGNLYYENMFGYPSILGCKIVRSSDNGLTWSSPVTAISGVDKNWLAVDQSTPGPNSPYAGYVYTCMTASSGGNFARSINNGTSWTTTFTPSTQSRPGMMVCVGAYGTTNGGAVYVVTNNGLDYASNFTFYRSLNGGSSFSYMSAQSFTGYVGTWTGTPARHSVENMRTRPYPYIAADNSNGTYRGRLYLVYATNNPAGSGHRPNIYCRYSPNGGLTWSGAVRINDDDETLGTNHQWSPAIWCDAVTGRLYVHWMDSRESATNTSAYIYASYSDNGGASFVTNQRISNEPMTINCTTCPGTGTPRYQGDYTSIVSHGGVSLSAWADFRDGTFDSYAGYFPDYAMKLTQSSKGTDGAAVILAQVPSVKLYTDDVTFTASMQTPGAGSFTITYPDGNTLSTFPGSIPIKVVDNSVPAGNYTLTVVGRGPNGTPVHERQLTINVSGTNLWTGTVSNNWATAGNWSLSHVPDQGEDVSIPSGTPYSPIIGDGTFAYCYNLTIAAGATLTQNGTSYFRVHGNFDSDQGTFTQNGVSYLYFDGTSDNWWDDDNEDDTYQHVRVDKDYSHFYTFMWQDMTVEQSFEIREGELKIDNIWTLTVNGSAANAFEVELGGKLTLIDESVNVVNGHATFYNGSQASILGGSISCGGNFNINDNASYDIQLNGCTLTMHGSGDQIIEIVDAGSYLNDFIIDKSGGICSMNSNLDVRNDLTIDGGTLNALTYEISLGNDWTNNVGGAGFVEGTSRVIFNGPGPDMQYVYGDEDFNIIENNTVQAIRINNYVVTCASYDWTSGSVSVSLGTFITDDLIDGGLYGDWYALTGSEIYLTQDAGSYVDVFSENILIYGGGIIKVTGGADESYWCGGAAPLDLEINTGGILDFDGFGITIWDNALLTETITDGTIRTSGWLTNLRADLNPTAGTFEFYGGTDSRIQMQAGSSFHDLLINKSGGDKSTYQVTDRDGKASMSSKTNAAILFSDIVVANNFDITDGTSNTSTFDMYVGGDWSNTVGPDAFVENTNTVFLDGPNDGDILTEETFYNLTVNKSNGNFTSLEANANVVVSYLMHIVDGVYEMNAGSNLILGNDVIIESGAGLNANDAPLNIYVGGNWTNYNNTYDVYHGFWHGYISTVIFNSGGDNILTTSAPQEDFYNLTVYKATDQFRSNDNIQVFGKLLLFDGEWNDNVSGLTHTFHGDFEVTNNAAWFTHISPNTVVFAGENDQDITYDHINVGYFNDVIVNKVPADKSISSNLDPSGSPANGENDGAKAQMLTMLTDIDIQLGGTLTIEEGTMEVNGNTLRGDGNITINTGGTLSLNSNSTLWVDDGSELSVNGGLLEAIGTPGNLAHITHRNTGYYAFEIEGGGTISAEYTKFEYTNANGVWIKGDGFADPVHTFHYCTFLNGTAGFAPLLVFNNSQVLTCNGVDFPQTGVSDYNVAKAFPNGEITMVDATGSFAGEDYEYDLSVPERIHWSYTNRSLDLTMFIEGPFNTSTNNMSVGLNSILPINQPFDTPPLSNPSPDWYYTGSESVGSIPNPFIVDWVLVELRDATSVAAALPGTAIFTQAAFITNIGNIVDLDGVSPLTFAGSITNNLYAVVWTRNHLGVISANPLVDVGGIYTYDFSSGSGQAEGGTSAQHQLSTSPAIWGVIPGDANGTGLVAIGDKTNVWWLQAGITGYLESDYNFDGEADNIDKNDYWFPNMLDTSFIPE